MKPFSKQEIVVVSFIFLTIVLVSLYNFSIAIRRGRDAQRKSDIGAITDALNKYANDFATFPEASPDGKIIACKGELMQTQDGGGNSTFIYSLVPCEWGKDALQDINDSDYPAYIATLPIEPQNKEGISYVYLSNRKRFHILASLEGDGEDEYDPRIEVRAINCGVRICNFGRSSGTTPLDRSIEKYENELEEKSK